MAFQYSIRQLKQIKQWFKDNPEGTVKVHDVFPYQIFNKNQWHCWLKSCLMQKINRQERQCRGRKDSKDYYFEMLRAARQINQSRLIIDWLPGDLKKRFAYRLRENCL